MEPSIFKYHKFLKYCHCSNTRHLSGCIDKLDTGRYTPECLTEREQVKHVSILVITENKTTILDVTKPRPLMCVQT